MVTAGVTFRSPPPTVVLPVAYASEAFNTPDLGRENIGLFQRRPETLGVIEHFLHDSCGLVAQPLDLRGMPCQFMFIVTVEELSACQGFQVLHHVLDHLLRMPRLLHLGIVLRRLHLHCLFPRDLLRLKLPFGTLGVETIDNGPDLVLQPFRKSGTVEQHAPALEPIRRPRARGRRP